MHGGDDYTGTSSVSLVLNPRLPFDRLQFIEAEFSFLGHLYPILFSKVQVASVFSITTKCVLI